MSRGGHGMERAHTLDDAEFIHGTLEIDGRLFVGGHEVIGGQDGSNYAAEVHDPGKGVVGPTGFSVCGGREMAGMTRMLGSEWAM